MSGEKNTTVEKNVSVEKEVTRGGSPAKGVSGGEVSTQAVQDAFLNELRRDHITVMVYLMNGIKLIGRIKSFDKFSVLLDAGQQEMLIFKHAISTISVQLPRPATETRRAEAPAGQRERVKAGAGEAKRE
jgi:host factor-I protein